MFARRLQIQERMTNQIAETIREKIDPLGVAVVCEGTHLCMSMRGVEKQNSFAVTSAMLGVFRDNARTRMEFLELIKHRGDRADRRCPPAAAWPASTTDMRALRSLSLPGRARCWRGAGASRRRADARAAHGAGRAAAAAPTR